MTIILIIMALLVAVLCAIAWTGVSLLLLAQRIAEPRRTGSAARGNRPPPPIH